ncbi:hypothetical protein BRARA_A02837 [Brassica rapa]|uniref:Uncharacterized protein n=1 Tax=Brassica campestris TaxID=3711 RepID=A0A398AT75_BRACM|nr:hypothetical protein BRARA_A02837 [Brassica rapa]
MMDSDIQISSGSSSSSSNCSGSDDELIETETSGILSAIIFLSVLGEVRFMELFNPRSCLFFLCFPFFNSGSGSFTSSAGNSQDSAGCRNHEQCPISRTITMIIDTVNE